MVPFRLLLLVLFILIVIWFIIGVIIREKVFYPVGPHVWTPDVPYLNGIHEGISYWYFKKSSKYARKTIIYCHGNTGNISHRKYIVDLCERLDFDLILFDYKGFGQSDQIIRTKTIDREGLIIYDMLVSQHDLNSDDIIVWGESFGGAAALTIACERPCYRLILLNTFYSIPDIFNLGNHDFRAFIVSCWVESYHAGDKIRGLNLCPVAVLYSEGDDLIPCANSKRIFEEITTKEGVVRQVEGGDLLYEVHGSHANPALSNRDIAIIRTWINQECAAEEIKYDTIREYVAEADNKHMFANIGDDDYQLEHKRGNKLMYRMNTTKKRTH